MESEIFLEYTDSMANESVRCIRHPEKSSQCKRWISVVVFILTVAH